MCLCMPLVHRPHILTMISMINSTSYNVGFPLSCQAAQHMALQIKADSGSVLLSLTTLNVPTSNQSSSSAVSSFPRMWIHTVTHTGLPQLISSLCFSRWACGMSQEKGARSWDDCVTISPHCCICHMDTRDFLWVRGRVNSSNAVPETCDPWGVQQSRSAGTLCAETLLLQGLPQNVRSPTWNSVM